jgi:hypothetical protein
MTVSPTSTLEFDIETTIRRAYNLAGQMDAQQIMDTTPQGTARRRLGADFLEMIIDALQVEGIFTRDVEFYDLTPLVAGIAKYALPNTTLDVIGTGMYTPAAGGAQTLVKPILREEYQRLSSKTAQGRPYTFYTERQGVISVYLWPTPDEAGKITFQRRRLLADVNDTSKTLDLERYWSRYITFQLAHDIAIASSVPNERCGYLRAEAERAMKVAKAYTRQRPPSQMWIDHGSPWSRGGGWRR